MNFERRIFNGLQYIGAQAPLYWSPLTTALRNIILWLIEDPFLSWINPIQMDWVLSNLICVIAKKYFRHTSLFCMTNVWSAPIYWSLGSNILEPLCSKKKFFVLFLNMKHGKQKVSSPLLRPSCDTQNLVLSELSLFIPSQNLENKI